MIVYFAGSIGDWEKKFFDEYGWDYNRLISIVYTPEKAINMVLSYKKEEIEKSGNSENRRSENNVRKNNLVDKRKKSSRRKCR
ncbi:MAG TPA: hypothetical protein PLI14_06540 [Bacilli bacterium]|jgi:hypothetical protein|nr:hypothetical protein [Bacilli bacterium]